MNKEIERVNVLGVGIHATSMQNAVDTLIAARRAGKTGYVCVTSVHGVMESQKDPALRRIHNRSFMTVPDGMPTVWMGREYGFVWMKRVYGPDLMLALCQATAKPVEAEKAPGRENSAYLYPSQEETGGLDLGRGNSGRMTHFLYGATGETLHQLKENLEARFPGIQIAGTYAPPFRPLTADEEADLQRQVAACRPDFFWVGLSTPKQERFMSRYNAASGEFPLDCGIMLGVGAAFDIHAGNYKDAPEWIKNSGLQWFFRLCKEPRRLWRRYLWIVPGFIWLSFLQVMGIRKWTVEK
jgi:N-acetylglucosaminyldiphosphoundecaprenol N-acetyl-beta-D-mannosaminyltransferase